MKLKSFQRFPARTAAVQLQKKPVAEKKLPAIQRRQLLLREESVPPLGAAAGPEMQSQVHGSGQQST